MVSACPRWCFTRIPRLYPQGHLANAPGRRRELHSPPTTDRPAMTVPPAFQPASRRLAQAPRGRSGAGLAGETAQPQHQPARRQYPVSVHVYNSSDDIRALVRALASVAPRWTGSSVHPSQRPQCAQNGCSALRALPTAMADSAETGECWRRGRRRLGASGPVGGCCGGFACRWPNRAGKGSSAGTSSLPAENKCAGR